MDRPGTPDRHPTVRRALRALALALCTATAAGLAAAAPAAAASGGSATTAGGATTGTSATTCATGVAAVGYSDTLDKLTYDGATVGGLSALAYDRRAGAWVAVSDNHGTDPARLWYLDDLTSPEPVRAPLTLTDPDGTPYTGTTADTEGLAVLPDGSYVVSSETEPSIRVFGRDGVQRQSLPVPARLAVSGTTAAGEATANATLEGLALSTDGTRLVAAMEGALSGDTSADGDATWHRFVVYERGARGRWHVARQLAYRAQPGMRIAEVAAYGDDALLVAEASWSAAVGNDVVLRAVTHVSRGRDVSGVADLSALPATAALPTTTVADLLDCPTLGATAKQTQTNPLLDNYEGLAVTARHGRSYQVALVSDDNFGATQITRVLRLRATLPR